MVALYVAVWCYYVKIGMGSKYDWKERVCQMTCSNRGVRDQKTLSVKVDYVGARKKEEEAEWLKGSDLGSDQQ